MPRKIRELKADLRRAGYRQVPRRGKGSHTVWAHPLVADTITISGHDGDDARIYQEQMVRDFVERAQEAESRERRSAVTREQHYSMVIEWSDDDQVYIVSLPEWGPGARTHGATYDEAVRNAQDVLELLIAGAQEEGKPLPTPHLFARTA